MNLSPQLVGFSAGTLWPMLDGSDVRILSCRRAGEPQRRPWPTRNPELDDPSLRPCGGCVRRVLPTRGVGARYCLPRDRLVAWQARLDPHPPPPALDFRFRARGPGGSWVYGRAGPG